MKGLRDMYLPPPCFGLTTIVTKERVTIPYTIDIKNPHMGMSSQKQWLTKLELPSRLNDL